MTGYAVADPKLSSATSTAAYGTSIRRLTSGKRSIWERDLCMRPKLFGRSSTDRYDLEISDQEPAIDRQSRPGRKTARQAHRVTAAVGARNPGSDGHFARAIFHDQDHPGLYGRGGHVYGRRGRSHVPPDFRRGRRNGGLPNRQRDRKPEVP